MGIAAREARPRFFARVNRSERAPSRRKKHFELRYLAGSRYSLEAVAWRRMGKPSPNRALQRARPVGAEIPAGAWSAIFPEKPANFADPPAPSHTCDRSPGNNVTIGDNVGVAQPAYFAASTALRNNGLGPEGQRACGISRVAKLAMNNILLIKIIEFKQFLSTSIEYGR